MQQQGCINGHHHGTAQSLNQSDIVHGADTKTVDLKKENG